MLSLNKKMHTEKQMMKTNQIGKRRIKLVNEILKHARDNKRETGPLIVFLLMCTDRGIGSFHKEYMAIEFKK